MKRKNLNNDKKIPMTIAIGIFLFANARYLSAPIRYSSGVICVTSLNFLMKYAESL